MTWHNEWDALFNCKEAFLVDKHCALRTVRFPRYVNPKNPVAGRVQQMHAPTNEIPAMTNTA